MKSTLGTEDLPNQTDHFRREKQNLITTVVASKEVNWKITVEKSHLKLRIYTLLNDYTFRPIAIEFDSPKHHLTQQFTKQLLPLAKNITSYNKKSKHLQDRPATITIRNTHILVSADIFQVITDIHICETLEVLQYH